MYLSYSRFFFFFWVISLGHHVTLVYSVCVGACDNVLSSYKLAVVVVVM